MEIKLKNKPMCDTLATVAGHAVMAKIAWTDLQRSRCATLEHAEILVGVVAEDYRDGMTTAELRRALASDDDPSMWDGRMLSYFVAAADRIAAALQPYVDKASTGDRAARHVLIALRRRHVWVDICKAADTYPDGVLDNALAVIYANVQHR